MRCTNFERRKLDAEIKALDEWRHSMAKWRQKKHSELLHEASSANGIVKKAPEPANGNHEASCWWKFWRV